MSTSSADLPPSAGLPPPDPATRVGGQPPPRPPLPLSVVLANLPPHLAARLEDAMGGADDIEGQVRGALLWARMNAGYNPSRKEFGDE